MKTKITKVSIVVITRNRYQSLMHNLGSLLSQSLIPEETVVVDNNSQDQTQRVVKAVAKNSSSQIRYTQIKKTGYPVAYNQGLLAANYQWVAFIDDDCVASHNWYQNIVSCIQKHPQADVFLGHASTFESWHPLALAENFIKSLGVEKGVEANQVLDFSILDSKNIVYSQDFLQKNQLKFDESLLEKGEGSSEDCDLGMQIQQAGGQAIYCPEIEVWHKDVICYASYYKKLVSRTKDHLIFENKWNQFRSELKVKNISLVKKTMLLVNFIEDQDLNLIQSSLLVLNVVLSFLIIKFIRIFYEK